VHKFAIIKKSLASGKKSDFFGLTLNGGAWGPFQQAKHVSHGGSPAVGLQEKRRRADGNPAKIEAQNGRGIEGPAA